jgi:tetratricopeptide (TPR) repeat protein
MLLLVSAPVTLRAQAGSEAYKQGVAAMQGNDGDAAVKAFEKAIAADEKNADYHLWLARALGTVAQKASVVRQPFLARRCKTEFERAAQLDPTNIPAREGLVQFYLLAPSVMGGSLEKAREQAEAIFKLNKLHGRMARGTIANKEKDLAGQERELRAAWTEYPDSLSAVTTWANFLVNNQRADEAVTVIDRSLATHKDNVIALFWLGRVTAAAGKQLDRGEKALRTVLASNQLGVDGNPPAANVQYRLGEVLAKKGDKVGARAAYEAALRLNPKLEQARKALKEL